MVSLRLPICGDADRDAERRDRGAAFSTHATAGRYGLTAMQIVKRLPQEANRLAVRLTNIWTERRLGISTRGVIPIDHEDAVHYATMAYGPIWRILSCLELQPDDIFVDIGCGKGRVLCCAARYPMEHVYGVDVSPKLCEVARANGEHLRGRRAPITVRNAVAQDFDYSEATVLFLFDPFGADTLRLVLDKLRSDTDGRADTGLRGVRIAYANPTHEAVLREQSWLQPTGHLRSQEHRIEHTVAFYRSRP
jgi:SAM-dependent methyltransferase